MLEMIKNVLEKKTKAKIEIVERGTKRAICARLSEYSSTGMVFYEDRIREGINELGFYKTVLEIAEAINKTDTFELDKRVEFLRDWDIAKGMVMPCLRKKTGDVNQVTRDFLDVEEYVRVEIDAERSAAVTHSLLSIWGITEQQLFTQAEENIKDYSMAGLSKLLDPDDEANDFVYFLGRKTPMFGAGIICNRDVLDEVAARLGSNFYIIPSSIHEVLVISDKDTESVGADRIRNLIKMVNLTNVAEGDVLSNNLYKYTVANGLQVW